MQRQRGKIVDDLLFHDSSSGVPFGQNHPIRAIATTTLFIASIFTPWAVVWGSIPVTLALIGWFWPRRKGLNDETHPPEKGCPELAAAGGRL